MTILQTILAAVNWDTRVNENFASVSPAAMYAFDPLSANLTLRIKGGLFGTATVADYSSALTASSGNNYVVYARADGSISRSTGTTNWNDDATYGRIGIANAGATTFTWSDQRTGPFVPPAGGTVASVNGQSGVVVLEVGDLDDVDLTGLANGDTLVWDSGTSTWVPGTPGGGSGTVTSVAYSFDASLADVFSIGGSPITNSGTLTASGVAPAADRLAFWDFSDGKLTWLTLGTGLSITGTTLDATGGSGGMTNPMTTAGDVIYGGAAGAPTRRAIGSTGQVLTVVSGNPAWADLPAAPLQTIAIAASDLVTNITAGIGKAYFYVPYNFTVVEVQASLDTAQTAGSIFTVDINESGSTILSTKITIDNNEGSSITAATPPVISDSSLAKGSKITVDVDQIGTTGARGLIVYLVGYPT